MSQSLIVYATSSGGSTIDRDAHGGNPFATALIDLSAEADLPLTRLLPRLRSRTIEQSSGHQTPEYTPSTSTWCLASESSVDVKERRVALVLVVADYSGPVRDASLEGAAHDERRVASMLASNGFSVEQGVGRRRTEILAALRAFRHRSSHADVAVVYCTGHGSEADGNVFLLPGDFPRDAGRNLGLLRAAGVSVERIAAATNGRTLNLVFFAGCRTRS